MRSVERVVRGAQRVAISLAAIGCCSAVALIESTAAGSCQWQVLSSRAASSRDTILEDRLPFLRDPQNPNRVPGPAHLVAVVRTDSLHHPHIFIEDDVRRTSRLLMPKSASQPRWSPDGKSLACVAWESQREPWVLTIVDRAGKRVSQPLRNFNVMGFSWSPNSKWIAAAGALAKAPRGILALVAVAAQRSQVVDTLQVLADYEVAWAPSSATLVVSRPTAIDSEDEVTAADLWAFDTHGTKCPLLLTPDFVESAPHWVNARRLRYARFRSNDPKRETEDIVVELMPPKAQ